MVSSFMSSNSLTFRKVFMSKQYPEVTVNIFSNISRWWHREDSEEQSGILGGARLWAERQQPEDGTRETQFSHKDFFFSPQGWSNTEICCTEWLGNVRHGNFPDSVGEGYKPPDLSEPSLRRRLDEMTSKGLLWQKWCYYSVITCNKSIQPHSSYCGECCKLHGRQKP